MPAMSTPTEYTLTTTDAANRLGVSDETIRRWAASGRLRHVKLPSGHRRFAAADIDNAAELVEGAAS